MRVDFVRHGKTLGNTQGRYVGRTDEPLLPVSLEELKKLRYPHAERVYASPMKRCIQSAGCLYPASEIRVYTDLREMDFGDFEYKNYRELNGNLDYQAYLDSGGRCAFPGGESLEGFRRRCLQAFREAMADAFHAGVSSVSFVVHGGTIMAILEAAAEPRRDYFNWQIGNGERVEGVTDDRGKIHIRER